MYPALLPLMLTPRLPVVDWTDAPCLFKWTRPFRRKTKSGFCACAITFQTQYTHQHAQDPESSWNVMAHGNVREGKWGVNWRIGWVSSTLHTTSEHGVSSITTADAHTSVASSRMNWRPPAHLNGLVRFAEIRNLVSAHVPSRFKRSKTKSGFCACTITFQKQ